MRTIGLSHSVGEKLAASYWTFPQAMTTGEIKVTLTHEEIAQMIGASRETVTRLFGEFKKRQLLQVKGSTLIIKNKVGFESILSS